MVAVGWDGKEREIATESINSVFFPGMLEGAHPQHQFAEKMHANPVKKKEKRYGNNNVSGRT